MSSSLKNLSQFNSPIPSAEGIIFGIVVSEWNTEVTSKLLQGAVDLLIKQGAKEENIIIKYVPGTFELTIASKWLLEYTEVDIVIALGCVIQGETRHFDFICNAVSNGITNVSIEQDKCVVFGVLTTENQEQALERAGGKHGNKGEEAAATAIKMATLENDILADFDDDLLDDDFFFDEEDVDYRTQN